MNHYITVKLVEAMPMASGEFNARTGRVPLEHEDPNESGYLIMYPDGYEGWCPKPQFEASAFRLSDPTKICEADVDRFAGQPRLQKIDAKTTLVSVETISGFVQHEASSCVDPANYDPEIGKAVGLERIKARLWPCLGFVLQWARKGLRT